MIFLSPQDEDEMISRLQERKTETPDGLKVRIATAQQEMTHINSFDYVVINRELHLDETVDTIISIIIAEHHRVKQRVRHLMNQDQPSPQATLSHLQDQSDNRPCGPFSVRM